jgi:MFS family permease
MAASRAFIWILAVSGFASTFSGRAVEPMVGVIARDLSTPVETIALLAAAFTLPYAFIQPILGPIGDAVGKERVMKMCLLVLLLALLGSVVAPDPPPCSGCAWSRESPPEGSSLLRSRWSATGSKWRGARWRSAGS